MIAQPERRSHIRQRRETICGRRNCGRCTRWHLITEFSVNRWADLEKTKPGRLSPWCRPCHRAIKREQYERRPGHPRPRRVKQPRDLVLSRPDMLSMILDGGVPLCATSLADEDYDPTPVPQGCPRCYLHGGERCINCPAKGYVWRPRKVALRT